MGIAAYNRGSKRVRDSIKTPAHVTSLEGSAVHPAPQPAEAIPRPFQVGETVYCRVTALRGQYSRVTATKRGYIKITGFNQWCPNHNFQREPI